MKFNKTTAHLIIPADGAVRASLSTVPVRDSSITVPADVVPASAGAGGVAVSAEPADVVPVSAGAGGVAVSAEPTDVGPVSAGAGGVAVSAGPADAVPVSAGAGGVAVSAEPAETKKMSDFSQKYFRGPKILRKKIYRYMIG